MKRVLACFLAVIALGSAMAFSDSNWSALGLRFVSEARNPVTRLDVNQAPDDFQFAIVSDRTGGHRANIFAQAVEKLNLLQPAFVVSVGDLIEGGPRPRATLEAEWKEFDGFVNRLDMPFFYVAGNHDAAHKQTTDFWHEKLGRTYYHFVYKDVLFLVLNNDDPPGSGGKISKTQIDFARKTLDANSKVRWTIVLMHRPLWRHDEGRKNGWAEVEGALKGRDYTVFVGHFHRYQKFVRNGMNYYQLATTGGGSRVRGPELGEFDHIVWVTMKKDGPVLANLMLDSIHTDSLQAIETNEPGSRTFGKTYPVRGKIFYRGSPIPGAFVSFQGQGSSASGVVQADGSFALTTYQANDGAPQGKFRVAVTWRQPPYRLDAKVSPNMLPTKYANPATSGLTAVVEARGGNEVLFELE